MQGVSKEKSVTCGILTEYQDKSGHNSASEGMLLYDDAYNSLSESSGGMAVAGCPCKNYVTSSNSSDVYFLVLILVMLICYH